jgi:hypothetical protein
MGIKTGRNQSRLGRLFARSSGSFQRVWGREAMGERGVERNSSGPGRIDAGGYRRCSDSRRGAS